MSGILQMLVAGARLTVLYTVSSNTTNFNLKSAIETALGGTLTDPVDAICTINVGTYVYSTSTSIPAFDTGTSWPIGSKVSIVNNGYIIGRGGDGGAGDPSYAGGGNGGSGGTAINLGINTNINNVYGYIYGGGGGGAGAGTTVWLWVYYNRTGASGGGGGAGNGPGGDFGSVYYAGGYGWNTDVASTAGTAGTLSTYGLGGPRAQVSQSLGKEGTYYARAGQPGNGGDFGLPGDAAYAPAEFVGGVLSPNHGYFATGNGTAGPAGKAVNLNGYIITYSGGGDGGNNATQVKGAQT